MSIDVTVRIFMSSVSIHVSFDNTSFFNGSQSVGESKEALPLFIITEIVMSTPTMSGQESTDRPPIACVYSPQEPICFR